MSAALIAEQDFNGLTLVTNGVQRVDHGEALGLTGTFYEGGDLGLGFETYWFQTGENSQGPSVPPFDSEYDLNGITARNRSHLPAIAPSGSPVEAGVEQNFTFNDSDGRVELHFQDVDISHYTDVSLSLHLWVNSEVDDTGLYPPWLNDRFGLNISDGSVSEQIFLAVNQELADIASPGDTPVWHKIEWSMEESDLTGNLLRLTFFAETDAGLESIVIDDVVIEGTHVPEPKPVLLLMLALAARFFLRRPPR